MSVFRRLHLRAQLRGKAIRDANRCHYVRTVVDREGGNYHAAKILFASERLDNLTSVQVAEWRLSQTWRYTQLPAFLGEIAFGAVLIEN